jgi:hypothetical protein
MQMQQEIVYSHDTPDHWTYKGRKVVEWPTKWLDPNKQNYTSEELKDWYCVDKTDQLKDDTLVRDINDEHM